MFLSSSRDKFHAFPAKLSDRCFFWFPAAILEPIRMGSSMASPYKSLEIWVKHSSAYLAEEKLLWLETGRMALNIYLLSFPRFWILSTERFWFLFWSILNGVTMKPGDSFLQRTGNYQPLFLSLFLLAMIPIHFHVLLVTRPKNFHFVLSLLSSFPSEAKTTITTI